MNEQVLAVQRMQDYIEANKTEEISLSDLARASLFSPWYAYRLFRACLGLTPAEYIRKYRLTQAAKQLRSGIPESLTRLTTRAFPMWTPLRGRFAGNSGSIRASIGNGLSPFRSSFLSFP